MHQINNNNDKGFVEIVAKQQKKKSLKCIEITEYKEVDMEFSFKLDIKFNFKKSYFIIENRRKNKY